MTSFDQQTTCPFGLNLLAPFSSLCFLSLPRKETMEKEGRWTTVHVLQFRGNPVACSCRGDLIPQPEQSSVYGNCIILVELTQHQHSNKAEPVWEGAKAQPRRELLCTRNLKEVHRVSELRNVCTVKGQPFSRSVKRQRARQIYR